MRTLHPWEKQLREKVRLLFIERTLAVRDGKAKPEDLDPDYRVPASEVRRLILDMGQTPPNMTDAWWSEFGRWYQAMRKREEALVNSGFTPAGSSLVAWMYSLDGRRHELYRGSSQTRATEALEIAAKVIFSYRLDATLTVQRRSSMGLDMGTLRQRDYYQGQLHFDREPRKLKLALDMEA